jgi:hypothetical protein
MLQKEAPRSLITFGEMMGGAAEQPRQFLSLHAKVLKPVLNFLILRLLLTSASLSGAVLGFGVLFLFGVEGSSAR